MYLMYLMYLITCIVWTGRLTCCPQFQKPWGQLRLLLEVFALLRDDDNEVVIFEGVEIVQNLDSETWTRG